MHVMRGLAGVYVVEVSGRRYWTEHYELWLR